MRERVREGGGGRDSYYSQQQASGSPTAQPNMASPTNAVNVYSHPPSMPPTQQPEAIASIMNNVSHGATDHSGDKFIYALGPWR